MPMVMEKTDLIKTVANASCADRVWFDTVRNDGGRVSFALPEYGIGQEFQVIIVPLVKSATSSEAKKVPRRSVVDMIGYGRRVYGEMRTTEEIMRELREGEDA